MPGRGFGEVVWLGKREKDAAGGKDAFWYGESSFSTDGDGGLKAAPSRTGIQLGS